MCVLFSDSGNDTCEGQPESEITSLPDSCFYIDDNGQKHTTLDVGSCGGQVCINDTWADQGECRDEHTYCCDVLEQQV